MENLYILVLLLILSELFEGLMQRSSTLLGILENLYRYYEKSVFLFFLMHPSFYLILFIILLTDILNISMLFLLTLKVFDIFYKLELMKKVFIDRVVSKAISEILLSKVPPWFFLIGLFTYPPLLYMALL
jgi:hypothetical protein